MILVFMCHCNLWIILYMSVNCSRTKFEAIDIDVGVFFVQDFFLTVLLDHSFDLAAQWFFLIFLSSLNCTHWKIKFDARKPIVSYGVILPVYRSCKRQLLLTERFWVIIFPSLEFLEHISVSSLASCSRANSQTLVVCFFIVVVISIYCSLLSLSSVFSIWNIFW